MNTFKSLIRRGLLQASIFTLAALFYPVLASAQTITQGYDADAQLQRGMIVGLKKDDVSKVEPINMERIADVHGVVVTSNDAAIAISEESQKVYIASGGKFDVLVSDQNGKIEAGDYVTVSSVSGIGMRSDENYPIVLGKALQSFSGSDDARFVSKATIKDANGSDKVINIGRVNVDITVGKNPLAKNADSVPDFLRKVGESIAGKQVDPPRLYLSLFLLLLTTSITGSVIYSAVRSGLISIGRNPLSKRMIVKGILQMVVVGFIIFFSGLFGVYLILRL